MNKTVVVTSIFGRQQAAIASEFYQRGWVVRGTAREAKAHPFADVRTTELAPGSSLTDAFRGADVVAYSLVQDHRPGAMVDTARSVAEAAAQAGVAHIVFNLAGTIDEGSDHSPSHEMRAARAAIQNGKVPSTVFQPTVYMDNIVEPWSLPSIVGGAFAYPAPESAPVSWLSHRSLAAYVVAAAESKEAVGKEYRIGGPEAVTGTQIAEILSDHLGIQVVYHRLPLDIMAAGLNDSMGSPAGDRIATLYARLDREPTFMDLGVTTGKVLGVTPESFADFVARQDWQAL